MIKTKASELVNRLYKVFHSGKKGLARNIITSFFFRIASAVCAFLLVPITLDYLDQSLFGLWMTILAFLNWTSVFDLGINNGLKNQLIYAFAKEDRKSARNIISTTYSIMFVFVFSLLLILLISAGFVNWNAVFDYDGSANLLWVVVIPLSFFILKLYTDLVYAVILADQRPGLFNFLFFLINLMSLAAVFLLPYFNISNRLFAVSSVLGITPFAISFLANVYFFLTSYRDIRPKLFGGSKQYINETLLQGFKFFILQLSVLVVFSTDNFIIIHLFNAEEVTVYNICYKFFGIFTIVWTVILTPFWAAFGDAFHRGNIQWIRQKVKLLVRLWWLLNLTLAGTLLIVDDIYRIWVGSSISVPFSLSIATAAFISIFSLANIYVYFINGIGKVHVMLIVSIVVGCINIPLSIFFAREMNFGVTGVMFATCICLLANPVISYIQYKMLINGRARGIWLR